MGGRGASLRGYYAKRRTEVIKDMISKRSQRNGALWLGICGFCAAAVYAPASVVGGLVVCPACKVKWRDYA